MRRWLHWQFVVPRALLVVVVFLAAMYILGIAARSIAMRSCESLIGARLDVGHARVSILSKDVVFSDLRLANPLRPWEDILTADHCELNFAAEPLLHKQAVVESGRLSGLRIDDNHGGGAFDSKLGAHFGPSAWFKDDVGAAAQKWLDQFGKQFSLDVVKQFDSLQRTEAFCNNWSKQSAAMDAKLQELDGRATELQEVVAAAQANPLRNDKMLDELRQRVAGLQKEFSDFRAKVEKLPDLLETERRAIVAARRHDEEIVKKRLHVEPVDANALTAYLLRDETAGQLNHVVTWLRRMREVSPGVAKPHANGGRGEEVLFAGCRQEPGLLIRSLQLEGAARIGGQPLQLRGELSNLTSEPRLHDQPIRLHLIGHGSMPLQLQATIDRTTPVARDELLVDCQGVLLPGVALGRTDQLAMTLAPSVGSLSVSVVVEGEKLSGDIQLVQQKVRISPVFAGAGSTVLAGGLEETLGRVHSIATRVSLGGTLDAPTCTLWSNLGAAVAEALKRGLNRAVDQHARVLLVEAGRRVDERLAEVDRQIADKQTRFANKTSDITARLQKTAVGELPRYRISTEPGGRRLPNNSLFR